MSDPFSVFLTGTDTEIGKTRAAVALIGALVRQNRRVAGMKPVAAGAELTPAGLRNDDALALMAAANTAAPYELVNPYCLALAASPHLAAAAAGVVIEPARIRGAFEALAARADCVVVEGAGGWLAPIGPTRTMADVARALGSPVVLVVGLRLGCLNHALLTAAAVRSGGCSLIGWIANHVRGDFAQARENVATLERMLDAPLLAELPFAPGERPQLPSPAAERLVAALASR